MKKIKIITKAKYEEVDMLIGVLVDMPKLGTANLKRMEKHKMLNGRQVPAHYRFGKIIGDSFVTQRYYFPKGFLGRQIICDVKIIKKTSIADPEREDILLDCFLSEEAAPSFELKIGTLYGSIPIKGSKKFISLIPLTE